MGSTLVEAAVNKDGSILAMRYRIVADVGAYFMARSASPLINAAHRVAGPYDIPNMEVECLGVLTNKPPTGPYRGAGGPESSLLLERIVDRIARKLGLDPVEVRRRNFLSKEAFPHTTATGLTYDSGDFAPALNRARWASTITGARYNGKLAPMNPSSEWAWPPS